MGGLTSQAWAQVRVVSWDVDGTLYDMEVFRRRLLWQFLRGLLALRWRSTLRALTTLRTYLRVMQAARVGPLEPTLWNSPAYLELVSAWFVPCVAAAGLRPGLLAVLDAVAASGRQQIVLSDLPSTKKLEVLGLSGRFSSIFAGQEIGQLKPSPELFRHVLDATGVEPHELLHVGDRADTDGGAAALGIHVVLVPDLARLQQFASEEGPFGRDSATHEVDVVC